MLRIVLPVESHESGLARAWEDARDYYAGIDPRAFLPSDPGDRGLGRWLLEDLQENARRDSRFARVADADGEALGFVSASTSMPPPSAARELMRDTGLVRVSIDALAVRRAHWREGIGTALVEAVEDWAREAAAGLIKLATYAHSPVSMPFYEALGYDHRAVVFVKYLTDQP